METTRTERVMHPDVYDTLELGGLAFGGIGAGKDFPYASNVGWGLDTNCPVCVWGMAGLSEEDLRQEADIYSRPDNPIARELYRLHISRAVNDSAVFAINERKSDRAVKAGKPMMPDFSVRVPFKSWAKELGVVRGNAEDFPESVADIAPAEAVGNDSTN